LSAEALLKVSADIERMMREFNIRPLDELKDRFPPNELLDLEILVAHRDFDKILDEYANGQKFAIVSGRGPSGPLHLGHILIFSIVKRLQDLFDVEVYIPLSDDEKLVFGKIKDLNEGEHWAFDNARYILALGFNPKKTKIYISSKTKWVYRYALKIARKLTLSAVKSAFGIDDSINPGVVFYAAVQIAHILQPEFDEGIRTVVPIGFDQDVYMRLSRDVAERLGVPKPASLYVRFFPGPRWEPMSSSAPETSIFVTDPPEEIWRKIMRAFSGGRPSVEEQRVYGGNPENCVIYEWLKFFIFKNSRESKKFAEECRSGFLVCGFDCKVIMALHLIRLTEELRKRAEKIDIEKYLWYGD